MSVGGNQGPIGLGQFLCAYHRMCSPTEKFGAADAEIGGDFVQTLDKIVVELDKYLAPGHDHMVTHMVEFRRFAYVSLTMPILTAISTAWVRSRAFSFS